MRNEWTSGPPVAHRRDFALQKTGGVFSVNGNREGLHWRDRGGAEGRGMVQKTRRLQSITLYRYLKFAKRVALKCSQQNE